MRSLLSIIVIFCGLVLTMPARSQVIAGKGFSAKPWNAYWIAPPEKTGREYGVYYFRKSIDLPAKPKSFIIKVSADNRYKLYVNGVLASLGPALGDIQNWNYETIDIAPYLLNGKNSIAVMVWNEADVRPEAQISLRTGFILQGNTPKEEILNTGNTWRCIEDKSYSPITGIGYSDYYVAGAGELVDMNKSIKSWRGLSVDESLWQNAVILEHGHAKGEMGASGWALIPSALPQMERTLQRIPVLRKADGISVAPSFPSQKTDITIPAHTTVTLLLDQTYLTTAYITFKFSGGKDAGISLSYAEALFDNLAKYGSRKGNRNDIDGKEFAGRRDSIISDGSPGQTFETRYWRTYRYIRLIVQTKDAPITIDDIYGTFTGYPFRMNAIIQTGNAEIEKIMAIGWRTARLDAMETYMDCPYYEQLQYIGDTRIQALVSYYNSGDDRLARNAINLIDHSRTADGLTLSRYPTRNPQQISTFSLLYIGMLHDYWMYRHDNSFLVQKLPGERSVLEFFAKYQQPDGSLNGTPFWTFVDWAEDKNWKDGVPPKGANGGSSILDLQLLMAYQMAAQMEAEIGTPAFAKQYNEKANQLKQTIKSKYWSEERGLYADNEDKNIFSQHANVLAILAGLLNANEERSLSEKILSDKTLTQCTIYFKYYMHQALVKSGLGNDYLSWLDIWRKNIEDGLTTWAEMSDLAHSRSDCHAWGASPNIEFYRTMLGIDSDAPGFSKIKIEPHLGTTWAGNISGEIPHPNGKISVEYVNHTTYQDMKINLPKSTSGVFTWNKKTYNLHTGANQFKIKVM